MDQSNDASFWLFHAGALYAGVGGYLVFTGLMSSYSILMIGLAIGGLIRLVRPRP